MHVRATWEQEKRCARLQQLVDTGGRQRPGQGAQPRQRHCRQLESTYPLRIGVRRSNSNSNLSLEIKFDLFAGAGRVEKAKSSIC